MHLPQLRQLAVNPSMKLSKKNLLMRNFPRLSPMREEIRWQKIPTVSKDLVNIYSGIMTQALVIAQKRTEWQNDPSAEWQKALVSHQCKVHYQKNGGTVQWHASVTLATCMIMWQMARSQVTWWQQMIKKMIKICENQRSKKSTSKYPKDKKYSSKKITHSLVVQDHHRQRKQTWSNNMMLRSKRTTNKGSKQKIRGPRMCGEFINRLHEEPRLKLYDPGNESFSIPMKYADLLRQSQTIINTISDNIINVIWTEAKGVNLSEEWTGTSRLQIAPFKVCWRMHVGECKIRENPKYYPSRQYMARSLDSIFQETERKINCRIGKTRCHTANRTHQQESTRYWPMTRITWRWLLMLVWNWNNKNAVHAVLCIVREDSRGKPQTCAISKSKEHVKKWSDKKRTTSPKNCVWGAVSSFSRSFECTRSPIRRA